MCDCFVFRQKTAYEMRISDWSSDVCSSDLDADRVVEGLSVDWRTLDMAIKPYPACRFAHAAVDALIALRHQHHLELNQIDHVVCGLPAKGILLVGDPITLKRQANTVVQGQFSMPFLAAEIGRAHV